MGDPLSSAVLPYHPGAVKYYRKEVMDGRLEKKQMQLMTEIGISNNLCGEPCPFSRRRIRKRMEKVTKGSDYVTVWSALYISRFTEYAGLMLAPAQNQAIFLGLVMALAFLSCQPRKA